MCSWWLLYTLVPVLVGIFLAEYKSDILKVIRSQFSDDSDGLELVMYVPSARNNFEQRDAIRKTWWGNIKNNDTLQQRVTLKFVVGRHPCSIHPDDRMSQFSCDDWSIENPPFTDDEMLAISEKVREETEDVDQFHGEQSIRFVVQHPVLLTKLGLFVNCKGVRAKVKLLEASTMQEIVSVTFGKEGSGNTVHSFRYKSVVPYILPKFLSDKGSNFTDSHEFAESRRQQGFEGVVVGENLDSGSLRLPIVGMDSKLATEINRSTGVIKFYQDDVLPEEHYRDVREWNSRPIHVVSFIYKINDLDGLHKHLATRSTRTLNWMANCSAEDKQLEAESSKNQDIHFVEVIDVYRNIPEKFLHFTKWAVKNMKFDFLLKADDDCYLDVERILAMLGKFKGVKKTWFGRFRHNWVVERHGKWAERDYPAVVYPKFACGSGYILTHDLVNWLARNANMLKVYQGEDVSMGIWMAAVSPNYIDEPLWQCEKECLSEMYSMPELRTDELQRIWKDRQECSDACGCN